MQLVGKLLMCLLSHRAQFVAAIDTAVECMNLIRVERQLTPQWNLMLLCTLLPNVTGGFVKFGDGKTIHFISYIS